MTSPAFYDTLSNAELEVLLNDANVNHDDAQYDACYEVLRLRDALPFDLEEDFECGDWDDDAALEAFSLECAFGPEE